MTAAAQGAQVVGSTVNTYECEDSGSIRSCWDVISETREVATPSGNYRSMVNVPRACLTQTDIATGEVVYHQCYVFQEFVLTKGDETQVEHARDITVVTEDGATFCYGFLFQAANGQLRVLIWIEGTGDEC
jgi:predicted adenine nucleotide alpha hydrolase (AANH) superfamily ATPase